MKRKKTGMSDVFYSQRHHSHKKTESDFQNQFIKEFYKIETNFHSQTSKNRFFLKRIFWGIIFLLVVSIFSIGIYFTLKIASAKQKISFLNEEKSTFLQNIQSIAFSILPGSQKLIGENDGRINILLLGIAGKNNPGENLTDTIMIMSIETKNKKIALLSLPRDLYARIPNTNSFIKINSLYQYGLFTNQGIEPLQKVIEEIIGLPLHYFLILDFAGFKKIIDNIGGINIYVDQNIYDSRYPGPNYSYETFEIQEGMHFLDGETALKYARVRHGDPEGDFGRAKRQQKVIQATKNKIFSLQTFLNIFAINKLINTISDHMKTNIQLNEIESFIRLSKEVDTQNIATAVVDAWKKDSLLKVSRITTKNGSVFILIPRIGNYSEIHEIAANIFNLEAIQKRHKEIENEKAKIVIFNRSSNDKLHLKIKESLQNRSGIKNITFVREKKFLIADTTTVIAKIDTDKIFTLDELLKKIPAKLEDKNINIALNKDTDFAIILGNDIVNTYMSEEITMNELNKTLPDQNYFQPINYEPFK